MIRRYPERGRAAEGETRMPQAWDEFTADELAAALAESRWVAEDLLGLAWDLEVKLPGTKAAFRSGMLRAEKVDIIARATGVLEPEEARAVEALVLDRAGKLTRGGLRSAVVRAVMQVAPDKARKRREEAAKAARVERWAEDSGNAALAGRELPAAEVLAADQKITWWAEQLRKAGLGGCMNELRARAYLDILLGLDSRPERPGRLTTSSENAAAAETPGPGAPGTGPGGPGTGPAPGMGPGGLGTSVIPAGFAGRVTMTIPLVTLLNLAERPGEIPGIGPIDPKPEANTSDCYQSQVLLNLLSEVGATAARHPPE